MNSFKPISPDLLFSKNDPNDIRLGDITRTTKEIIVTKSDRVMTYLLGYPDDEGIKLNGGRVGASLAPAKIREYFYKMTPPLKAQNLKADLFELGDLSPESLTLGERHELAKNKVFDAFKNNARIITLGGGHDYGYPDAAAFVKYYKSKNIKPIVINFDAHLDVRPSQNGFNSGTPFYRLLTEYKDDVHFFEIGIQPQCNSVAHREWALNHGATLINLDHSNSTNDLLNILTSDSFKKATEILKTDTPLFISFDIDALSSSEAGGCSQSWVTGLHFQDYLNFFNTIKKQVSPKGIGIYEVSPPLDTDNRTSKTAALIAYYFLFQAEL